MIPTSNIAEHLATLEAYARRCRVLIEIGTETGAGSTYAFRCGFEANWNPWRWVSVDWKYQIDPWLRPRFTNWVFILGDSRLSNTADKVASHLGCHADLIFIDTDHNYEQLKAELEVWKNLAAPECTWLLHDTHMNGVYNHMTDAAKEFAERTGKWTYQQLSERCHGLGALVPKS